MDETGAPGELEARSSSVTALDASPEMLTIASERVADARVSFERADLFAWRPARRYDFVFFGFWLSHVPLVRLEQFWGTVADALAPGGTVFFVDDAYRTEDELIEGEQSSTIRRRVSDGRAFRAVKVAHEPAALQRRLEQLGWQIEIGPLAGPFFRGRGTRGSPWTPRPA